MAMAKPASKRGVGDHFMAADQQSQAADQDEHGEAAMAFAP